jgi:hypothetical protein
MKTPTPRLLGLALLLPLCACTPGKDKNPRVVIEVAPKFEELTTAVPANFTDSAKWNKPNLCPEGAVLTPFTRYDFEPGQNSHGFKYYYGRSCAIIQNNEPESEGRKLASTDPKAGNASLTVLPHGPFIWWYESGKRMESGSFDHGTLSTPPMKYDPDGAIAAKE